jgi:hypothetical protein
LKKREFSLGFIPPDRRIKQHGIGNKAFEPCVFDFMGKLGRNWVLVLFSTLIVLFALLPSTTHAQTSPDFTQTDAMLDLLRVCHANKASRNDFDRVISLPGASRCGNIERCWSRHARGKSLA